MDQYIKELLLLHSKIILPKFGAIVIVNDETGELSFNEYLSYDDGKLSALLESESNMDLQQAQNSVAKFVRELKLQLNKGETYSIYQLGEFSKDDNGSFIFEGNIKNGGKAASDLTSGPSPTPTSVATPKVEEIPVEKKIVEPKVEREIEVKKAEESSEPKESVKKVVAPPVTNSSKEKSTESTEGKKNVYIEKNKDVKPTPTPASKVEHKTEVVQKDKKRRKGFLFWFLLILLLLIVSGSVLVFTNQEKVEEYMGWTIFDKKESEKETKVQEQKKEAVENTTPKEVETVKDTTNKEEPVQIEEPEPIKEETVAVSSSNGQHHIIAGCFSEKSNADKMVNELKEKGFDSKIISQLGGLYFVAAQSYPSSKAAYADLSRVRQTSQGAWLFKY